jgi:RNA polymerase sigma factor (TIGR02999 family)
VAAARAVREVLRDYARQRYAQKLGGGWKRLPLEDVILRHPGLEDMDSFAFSETLEDLENLDKRWHDIVVLRIFGGLTNNEIASQLDVSLSTVEKEWRAAKAWLGETLYFGKSKH